MVRGQPKGGPPPEFTLFFSSVGAPKLARQANPKNPTESDDEVKLFILVQKRTVVISSGFFAAICLGGSRVPTQKSHRKRSYLCY